jgi:hypothetical protein
MGADATLAAIFDGLLRRADAGALTTPEIDRPADAHFRRALKPALCLSKRRSGSVPVMPT